MFKTREMKRRYIAFFSAAKTAEISKYLKEFFGEENFAKTKLKFIGIGLENEKEIKVIRCSLPFYGKMREALNLASENKNGLKAITIVSSGTIKSLKKKLEKRTIED